MWQVEKTYQPSTITDRRRVRTKALINVEDTIDMNNIENLVGLPGLVRIIGTLKEGYLAVKNLNIRAAIKFMADAYLIYSFVVKPAVGDVDKISKKGRSMLKQLERAQALKTRRRDSELFSASDIWSCTNTKIRLSSQYSLRYKDDLVSHIIISMERLGVLPSATNLWDLVPFSFVIDWFLNIGDVLDAFRLDRDSQTYTLLARIESQKYQFEWSDEFLALAFGHGVTPAAPVKTSIYRRRVFTDWGSTDPLLLAGGGGLGITQYLQGGALFLQRMK